MYLFLTPCSVSSALNSTFPCGVLFLLLKDRLRALQPENIKKKIVNFACICFFKFVASASVQDITKALYNRAFFHLKFFYSLAF